MCSARTWNLRKLRIAQRKLGIPSLAGKLRIEHKLAQTLSNETSQLQFKHHTMIAAHMTVIQYTSSVLSLVH